MVSILHFDNRYMKERAPCYLIILYEDGQKVTQRLKSSLTQDLIHAEQEPVKDKSLLAVFTCMHLLVDTTLSSSFVLDGGTFECQQSWNDELGLGRLAQHSLILVSY